METYVRNRNCQCLRCLAWDLMGASMLITLGTLFLLSTLAHIRFHYTWPVVLIVIGIVMFLRSSGPTTGHISPGAPGAAAPPPSALESKDPSHG